MKVRKVHDQPGGAVIEEVVAVRPPEEFNLELISDESREALRNAATVEEFKRVWMTVRLGRDAAEAVLGPVPVE